MDVKHVEKRAEELFSSGLFCAESVLQAIAELVGVNSPLVPNIATGFCGGISRTKGICGAVSGGVMALSMVFGRSSAETPVDNVYEKVQEFLSNFEKQHGSHNCFILTGCDLSTPEGRKEFKEKGMRNKCQELTGSAAGMSAEIIGRTVTDNKEP